MKEGGVEGGEGDKRHFDHGSGKHGGNHPPPETFLKARKRSFRGRDFDRTLVHQKPGDEGGTEGLGNTQGLGMGGQRGGGYPFNCGGRMLARRQQWPYCCMT